MKRQLLLGTGIVLIVALAAVGTGAVDPGVGDLFEDGDQIEEDGNVTGVYLAPADSPEGDAYVELAGDDDTLSVEIDDLSPDSQIGIDDLFVVGYDEDADEDQNASVAIDPQEVDDAELEFVNMETNDEITTDPDEIEDGGLHLEPGDTTAVGVEVETGTTETVVSKITFVAQETEAPADPPAPPAPPAPPEPPEDPDKIELIPEIVDDNQQQVVEPGIGPGTSVTVDLHDEVQNDEYTVDEVGFNTVLTTVTDLDITFTHTDDRPAGVAELPTQTGGLTFVELEYDDELDDSVEGVTLTTDVSTERLAADDRDPEDVGFYRFDDGDWEHLDAEIMEETDETVTYLVDSPGLSVYAPTYEDDEVEEPGELTVVDAELDEGETVVGDEVELTVEVENVGDEQASFTIDLQADDDTVETTEIVLDGGQTSEFEVDVALEEPGEYEIKAEDEFAGMLTVVEEVEEPVADEFSFLWYIVVAVLLLALLGTTAYFYEEGKTAGSYSNRPVPYEDE